MSKVVKDISISKGSYLVAVVLTSLFQRIFSKTERNGVQYDSSGRVMKRGSVGSDRVG